MLTIIGFIFALLHSFTGSASAIIAQQFKVDPPVLALYRGLGLSLLILPFLIFIPYPTSPMFYILVVANGLIASQSFRIMTDVINKHGANITSKFSTVPPVLVALVWWIINPEMFHNFINEDPYKAVGAIFCLFGMFFTIFALGKNKHTKDAMIEAIPVFICYTAQTFITFFALKEVGIIQGIFYYMFFQALIIGIINYFLHIHHLKGHVKNDLLITIFDKKILKAGLLFILAVASTKITIFVAFKLLPNPSYIGLIGNLQIIWIYIASRFLHVKHTISPTKGIILVIYAITFIILTF